MPCRQTPVKYRDKRQETIDKCNEELISATKEARAVSAQKRRHRADPRPPITFSIRDEMHLKRRLKRQWHVMRDPALKAVGKLSAERVEERIMEQYAGILRQWQPVTVEDDKVGGESSCSFAPLDCGGKTSSP